jgi:hypothetical protein
MPGNDELQKLLDPSRYGPSQAPTIPARDDTFWPAGNHRFGDVSVGGFGEDPTLAALLGKPFRSGKLSFEAGLKFTPGRRKKRP